WMLERNEAHTSLVALNSELGMEIGEPLRLRGELTTIGFDRRGKRLLAAGPGTAGVVALNPATGDWRALGWPEGTVVVAMSDSDSAGRFWLATATALLEVDAATGATVRRVAGNFANVTAVVRGPADAVLWTIEDAAVWRRFELKLDGGSENDGEVVVWADAEAVPSTGVWDAWRQRWLTVDDQMHDIDVADGVRGEGAFSSALGREDSAGYAR